MIDKSEVVAWLRQQSDRTFFETIYESAVGRGVDHHDSGWLESHVVVGYAERETGGEDHSIRPWSTTLVALPQDPSSIHSDSETILCQHGHHCGTALISWAKELRCPVCGESTYAT